MDTGHYRDGEKSESGGSNPELFSICMLNLSEVIDGGLSGFNVWVKHTILRETNYFYNVHANNDLTGIAEFKLLCYIFNAYKLARITNSHYSPILYVCINTCSNKVKF